MEEKLRSIESEISLAEECTKKQTKDQHQPPDDDDETVIDSSSRQMLALDEQERRTRIAFLQNRQAELETEIRLLRSSAQQFDSSNDHHHPDSSNQYFSHYSTQQPEMMNLTPTNTL